MKSFEILAQAVRERGIGVLAENFHVSRSHAYRWQQNPVYGSGEPNPLDRMKELLDELTENGRGDISANIRSFLFPDNEKAVHSETLAARFGVNANRCFIEIQDALRDGEVDDAERARILKGIHKIEDLCIEVRALCRGEGE